MSKRAWQLRANTILRLGARGQPVVWLQKRLEALGYDVEAVDGHYGYLTEDSVCALQKTFGLPVDGVVGPQVLELLMDDEVIDGAHAGGVPQMDLWGGIIPAPNEGPPVGVNWESYQRLRGLFLQCCQLDISGELLLDVPADVYGPLAKQVELIPLITNLETDLYNADILHGLLRSRHSRRRFLTEVKRLAESRIYSGIAVDLHGIEMGYGRRLTVVIKNIWNILQKCRKKLYLTLVPSEGPNPFPPHTDHSIWTKLAHRVILHPFGEYITGTPGPRVGWNSLQTLLPKISQQIPTWRLIVTLPLGGIAWVVGGGLREYIYYPYDELRTKAYEKRARLQSDAVEKVPYYDFREGGKRLRMWYENHDSLEVKLTWLSQQHIAGVILMPLGWEDGRIWQAGSIFQYSLRGSGI